MAARGDDVDALLSKLVCPRARHFRERITPDHRGPATFFATESAAHIPEIYILNKYFNVPDSMIAA